MEVLRFITCGSVDDGKSTLLGRLLHESHAIPEDQMRAIESDSRMHGTQGGRTDFALLLDGLEAEREQAITIDVAYRHFASARRRFIAADTPGHDQYTRNMATAASTATLAVILVDARHGVVAQTRRHTRIVAMMGIRRVVLAVNKMDLVGYAREAFERIAAEYGRFAESCGVAQVQSVPVSALEGDFIFARSARMPWHAGPSLMELLDSIEIDEHSMRHAPFRMPVQFVKRPDPGFRGVSGRIVAGRVAPGDTLRVLPSGVPARVREVISGFGAVEAGHAGESVTLTFESEVDVARGDVLAAGEDPPPAADQFEAKLLWMDAHPLIPGRPYLLKIHSHEVTATVSAIKHRVDVDSGAQLAAKTLALNDIGVVNLSTSAPVVFEPYAVNRALGAFILVDKVTFATVGAGMIDFALRRAANIRWQALDVDQASRAASMHQQPRCVWLTGLPASGKSTIANLLEKRLHAEGRHTFLLDGDNVRHGLSRDLGFTEADRAENVRRVAEVARLMVNAGLVVVVSLISPYRAERRLARALFAQDEFVEVFVDTPLAECERRDPKGLYARARRGEVKNFTGIDNPYEAPEAPEVRLRTTDESPEACVERIARHLSGEKR
jgi:bifunctional enzyme CysN/CysC